ncbi:MAG: hypothetical protein RLZZ369_1271 [Pseudomonadota bacterium]
MGARARIAVSHDLDGPDRGVGHDFQDTFDGPLRWVDHDPTPTACILWASYDRGMTPDPGNTRGRQAAVLFTPIRFVVFCGA